MKILHIVPTYFPATRYGGPIQSVHNLNKGLVKSGHQVTVFTTNIDGDKDLSVLINSPQILDGVEVWYFPATFRPWFYSSTMRKALIEKTKEFDLVHITSVFLSVSTLGTHYAKKFNKPYIISPRGSLMVEPLKKSGFKKHLYLNFIEKCNLAGASAIHFTTELEKKEYEAAGLPVKNSLVIPNFLEPINNFPERGGFRKGLGLKPETKVILSLGRLNWKKGFDTLIPAFAKVQKDILEAKLVIVGGDEANYKKEIELLIAKCLPAQAGQLQSSVIFTGELKGEEKLSAYQDADLFVLPSYAENFAMTVLESAQCGVPSIVTPAVGLAEEIQKNGAGLIIEKDSEKLAEAIMNTLKDDSGRLEMGRRAKLMAENFTPSKLAPLWEAGYHRFI
ncbi:MAG: glycosyltransferase [Candidatus Shapirobacteria bacterium]|jgi:glycosyltransferase involved in cell wall biosynthesis